MKTRLYVGQLLTAFALQFLLLHPANAQSNVMRAEIRGGGGNNGKCTFEVEVDAVAEVEIRGDQGMVRTISGSPATWRRLVCNQPLPAYPANFRFQGIDGRGRQTLVRDPNSNRGVAVVRLEDPKGGREGYTGDIMWSGSNQGPGGPGGPGWGNGNGNGWNNGNGNGNGNGWNNGGGNGWGNNGNWGNNANFNGRGGGNFSRNGGPNYNLSTAQISINNGTVSVRFNVNGGQVLDFSGRVGNMNNGVINANLVSATNQGSVGQANGNMQIQIDNNRKVRTINMNGNVAGGDFRLNWSGR
jgi:hypothetical protein